MAIFFKKFALVRIAIIILFAKLAIMYIAIIFIFDKNVPIIKLPYFLWLKLNIDAFVNYGWKNFVSGEH